SNQQIAERLVLTSGTVANHVGNILAKLQVESRVHVAVKVAMLKTSSQSGSVLALLERLRQVRRVSLYAALQHASDVLSSTFAAEKVDAFVFNPQCAMLVAVGTSQTAVGRRQHELGLNRLPIAHGGRA